MGDAADDLFNSMMRQMEDSDPDGYIEENYNGLTILGIEGEWYFVTETYFNDEGDLEEGSDEMEGPFETKEDAQKAALRWLSNN